MSDIVPDWTKGIQKIQRNCSRAGKKLNMNYQLGQAGPPLPDFAGTLPKEIGIIIPIEFTRLYRIGMGRMPQFDGREIIVKDVIADEDLAKYIL